MLHVEADTLSAAQPGGGFTVALADSRGNERYELGFKAGDQSVLTKVPDLKIVGTFSPASAGRDSVQVKTTSVDVPLSSLSGLGPTARWSMQADVIDTADFSGLIDRCPGARVDMDAPTGRRTPPAVVLSSWATYPSDATSGTTTAVTTPVTQSGPPQTAARNPSGPGCPSPLPDRLAAEQAAQCFYAGWTTNDSTSARRFTMYSDQAVTELFKLPQESRKARFAGCEPFAGRIPGIGDLTPPNANLRKCEFTYGDHVVDVYVNSTPSAGSLVVAIGLDGGGLGSD
jgi:hypothetical protein